MPETIRLLRTLQLRIEHAGAEIAAGMVGLMMYRASVGGSQISVYPSPGAVISGGRSPGVAQDGG